MMEYLQCCSMGRLSVQVFGSWMECLWLKYNHRIISNRRLILYPSRVLSTTELFSIVDGDATRFLTALVGRCDDCCCCCWLLSSLFEDVVEEDMKKIIIMIC